MGVVGSLMVPLLIGVEASVGATDKTQEHSTVGLVLLAVYFVMVFAGRVRYLKLQGRKVGRKTYFWSAMLHKYGGIVMVILSWWNCYTGLVRIGPEDSYFQVFVLSSFPLGYDIPIFGIIRQYVFFPYLGFVCFLFVIAEARRYGLNGSSHAGKLKGVLEGKGTIWDDEADEFLEKMTMESFLEATKLGSALCIVDGYVLDITKFMENHPGGQHLLRYAAGSDITEEFVGVRDVDGLKHVHSHSALELMKTLVKAVLVDDSNNKLSFLKGASSRAELSHNPTAGNRMPSRFSFRRQPTMRRGASVFRRGRVVGMRYLTPDIEITHTSKPVILLQLALPKTRSDLEVQKLISLPSCAFTFRGVDRNRVAVDRQYTPVKVNNTYSNRPSFQGSRDDEEIFDFIISLVPGGKLSKILLDTRMGKMMLAQGPTVNQETVQAFRTGSWETVVMIAAGTGVSPMLQVIDFYLSRLSSDFGGVASKLDSHCPDLFLMWIVKGPQYNYSEALALDTRVEVSQGKFKYTIIYSSSREKAEGKEGKLPKTLHGWSFKQIVDKSVPSSSALTGRLGFSQRIGLVKPKKVKRHVVDAAWRSKGKRAASFKLAAKADSKKNTTSIRESFRGRKDWITSRNAAPEMDDSSDDSSIENEINKQTWLGDVQCNYRCYSKELLEELLLSIPSNNSGGERRSNRISAASDMPPIIEETLGNSSSEFCSTSENPADSITVETEGSSPETSEQSVRTEQEITQMEQQEISDDDEDDIPWRPQSHENTTESSSVPRSSWLPPLSYSSPGAVMPVSRPQADEQDLITPVSKPQATKVKKSPVNDIEYESFDHKHLIRQNSGPDIGQRVASKAKKPALADTPGKKVSKEAPKDLPSKTKSLEKVKPTEEKSALGGEPKKRPGLEDEVESKRPPVLPPTNRRSLYAEPQRVDEYLDEFEIKEQAYKERKILIAISGAPMFEYKTQQMLHDELAFPREQMVTFHASATQI
eukprot:scaffold1505_cov118-Cylindrotheca_fusiformis.AAC.7